MDDTVTSTTNSSSAAGATTMTRKAVFTNVVVLSAAFFLLFAAFQAVSSLQTSINSQQGLGSTSLSVIYACLIVSCLLLPELVIGLLTIKWTLVVCICGYGTYILANVAPSWYTLIPTSVLVGLAAGPLWTSECTYITEMGRRLDALEAGPRLNPAQARLSLLSPVANSEATELPSTGTAQKSAVSLLFGIFYCFFQTGAIVGNLISSLTLQQGAGAFVFDFESPSVYASRADFCGGNFCPKLTGSTNSSANGTDDSGRFRPSPSKIYLLCSVYTGMSLAAALLIALFLRNYPSERTEPEPNPERDSKKLAGAMDRDRAGDDSPDYGMKEPEPEPEGSKELSCCRNRSTGKNIDVWKMCFATVKQMRDTRQLLLIPLSVYSGLQQGFMAADFTKSYVSCIYGVKFIGFTMMAYGLVNAVVSPASGYLNKRVPRWVLFAVAAIIHFSIFPVLAFHTAGFAGSLKLVFVFAGLWGAFDGIWQPQINALYGSLFQKNPEPAFSNHRLWESLGFIMSYSYHDSLCIRSKLLILFVLLIVCCVTYITVEVVQGVKDRRSTAGRHDD